MNAESQQLDFFTPQDLNLMATIANQLGNAVHKFQLEEDHFRHAQHIEALYETALAISSLTDSMSLYQKLYQQVNALFELDIFFLVRVDVQTDQIELVHVVEDGILVSHMIGNKKSMQESGLTGWVIQNKTAFLSSDLRKNKLPVKPVYDKTPIRSFMGVPLIAKDEIIGGLSIQSYQPNMYNQEQLRMLELLASQAAIALENADLLDQSRRQIDQLTSLHDIDMVINSSLDLRVTLNILLDQVVDKLGVDAAAVLLLNPATQMLEYMAGRGFKTGSIERYRLRMGEGTSGQATMERHLMQALNLEELEDDQTYTALMQAEGFATYFSVPLIAKGQVKGVLDIFNRTELNPEQDWIIFLETLSAQAAIAIDNTTLLEDLQRSNVELTLAYDTTLEGWSRALDMRDEETEGHTQRVAELTIQIASQLGMSDEEIIQIRRGALLHDIGKMGIPDEILRKPGPLTEEEWHIMRTHPLKAYELLTPILFLRPALDIPHYHHEKFDGSGYPNGLKGEQIPLAARIFTLADVWDALTSDRPYRKAWPEKKALDYIKEQSGKHFDPQILDIFLQIIRNELIHHPR
jgi:putative nucleotidyltransferase with HDIG domain